MIAIHNSKGGFHPRWVAFCEQNHIPFKRVDCLSNHLLHQLKDCDALMWHHSQNNRAHLIIAEQILFSLQQAGKKIFPDFNTAWHFDDKVGQKYLLEAINAPLVVSYVFYGKKEAVDWAKTTTYPKVFKLRGGAGSANVKLVKNIHDANRLIRKAFGSGFKAFDSFGNLKEVFRKFRLGNSSIIELFKASVRLIYPPEFAKVMGREYGYVYFQDFIPENDHDIRVIVIGDKAFAIKRMVRDNDFRASGSGNILYNKELFDENIIKLSFEIHNRLKSQCTAMDFVYLKDEPRLVEISYGFAPEGYVKCPGYWDKDLTWHDGAFDPYGWMVEEVIKYEP
jgi:glutathione synthase/RimK-type ligase-like ATP-grasp enzyme